MILLLVYVFGVTLAVLAAGLAAFEDARRFQIPNVMTLLVVIGFILSYTAIAVGTGVEGASHHPFESVPRHMASIVFIFIVTFGLFTARIIGAGDAKLLSAMGLWFSPLMGLPLLIWYTTLCGGLLGVATILLKKYKPLKTVPAGSWLAAAQAGENRVPYGVAIAAGFALVLFQLGYLDIMSVNKLFENGG